MAINEIKATTVFTFGPYAFIEWEGNLLTCFLTGKVTYIKIEPVIRYGPMYIAVSTTQHL